MILDLGGGIKTYLMKLLMALRLFEKYHIRIFNEAMRVLWFLTEITDPDLIEGFSSQTDVPSRLGEKLPPRTPSVFYESLIRFPRVCFSIRPTVIFAMKAPTNINRLRNRAWGLHRRSMSVGGKNDGMLKFADAFKSIHCGQLTEFAFFAFLTSRNLTFSVGYI